jgi:hypothetical protein
VSDVEYWHKVAQVLKEENKALLDNVNQLERCLKEWKQIVCVDTGAPKTGDGECPKHHGDACLVHWAAREWRQRAEKAEGELDELRRGKRAEKETKDKA